MKVSSLGSFSAFLAVGAFCLSTLAQHGGGHGAGGGMGAGMGAGASSHSHMADAPGGHSSMGSAAPSSALSNPKLDSSLTKALQHSGITVPGGNLQSACSGFKNLGQCVAALHVSKNLDIPFTDLQGKMTGPGAESLGKAIDSLRGTSVNSKSEAKKATKAANEDLTTAENAS